MKMYKIFTDPIHGFITIPKGILIKLIDHPYMQRMRRIRQLGLAYLIFPGAEHSRFSHAIGTLGLAIRALNNLREKNTTITNSEYEGTLIAALLHDIGHGPFSHTLENTFIHHFNHEMMTLAFMRDLNRQFDGKLDTAIAIFTNRHPKKFLTQLIASQLDVDRLDYLRRDSIQTGVTEGSVGVDRIIKTLRVHQGNIVIEKKGIYAIENYIIARRLMYMQVYLHKTTLSADKLLRAIFTRVKQLLQSDSGDLFFASPGLRYFLSAPLSARKKIGSRMMSEYAMIDDHDVITSIKYWQQESDPVLADLCRRFLNRDFFRTTFLDRRPATGKLEEYREKTRRRLIQIGLPGDDEALSCYFFCDQAHSEAYRYENESIWILDGDTATEFSKASETKNIRALSEPVVKHYLVHLKEIS